MRLGRFPANRNPGSTPWFEFHWLRKFGMYRWNNQMEAALEGRWVDPCGTASQEWRVLDWVIAATQDAGIQSVFRHVPVYVRSELEINRVKQQFICETSRQQLYRQEVYLGQGPRSPLLSVTQIYTRVPLLFVFASLSAFSLRYIPRWRLQQSRVYSLEYTTTIQYKPPKSYIFQFSSYVTIVIWVVGHRHTIETCMVWRF